MRTLNMVRISAVSAVLVLFALSMVSGQDGPKWVGAFFVKGKVGLKWQDFEGASEYSVYRKIGSGSFEKISTTDKTQYFDTELSGGQAHVYKVAAIDATGKEIFSEEKSVTVPGSAVSAFQAPKWVGLRTDRRGILLNWDKVAGAVGYNVYRSTTPGGPYDVVGNASTTKYADYEELTQGGKYYYVLTAMNEEFEETEYSEERDMQFGVSDEEQAAADAVQVELEETKLTFLYAMEDAGAKGTMNQPYDVFVNSKGDIYVSDTRRFQIECFDSSGKFKFSFGDKTPRGEEEDPPEGTFLSPMPLFIDGQDQVYVGDTRNSDIQVFTANGDFVKRIQVVVSGDQQGFRPNGLCVLDDGRIIATDAGNHRLLILDQEGNILFETNHGGTGTTDEEKLWFSFPSQVRVTSDNIICVVDQMGARVQQFDLDGNFVRSFGSAGYAAGQFGRPKGVAVAPDGHLWISDGMANTIQIFTPDGQVKSAITGFDEPDLKLTSPSGMFLQGDRFYLVTRLTNKVLVFKVG